MGQESSAKSTNRSISPLFQSEDYPSRKRRINDELDLFRDKKLKLRCVSGRNGVNMNSVDHESITEKQKYNSYSPEEDYVFHCSQRDKLRYLLQQKEKSIFHKQLKTETLPTLMEDGTLAGITIGERPCMLPTRCTQQIQEPMKSHTNTDHPSTYWITSQSRIITPDSKSHVKTAMPREWTSNHVKALQSKWDRNHASQFHLPIMNRLLFGEKHEQVRASYQPHDLSMTSKCGTSRDVQSIEQSNPVTDTETRTEYRNSVSRVDRKNTVAKDDSNARCKQNQFVNLLKSQSLLSYYHTEKSVPTKESTYYRDDHTTYSRDDSTCSRDVRSERKSIGLHALLDETLPNMMENSKTSHVKSKFSMMYYLHQKNENRTDQPCACESDTGSILFSLLTNKNSKEVLSASEDEGERSDRPDTPTWLSLYEKDADPSLIAAYADKNKKAPRKLKKTDTKSLSQRRLTFTSRSSPHQYDIVGRPLDQYDIVGRPVNYFRKDKVVIPKPDQYDTNAPRNTDIARFHTSNYPSESVIHETEHTNKQPEITFTKTEDHGQSDNQSQRQESPLGISIPSSGLIKIEPIDLSLPPLLINMCPIAMNSESDPNAPVHYGQDSYAKVDKYRRDPFHRHQASSYIINDRSQNYELDYSAALECLDQRVCRINSRAGSHTNVRTGYMHDNF